MAGMILQHILAFGHILHGMGVPVSSGQLLDLAAALEYVPLSSKIDFYSAARATLVKRHEHLALFDQAFEFFWRQPGSPNENAVILPELQPRMHHLRLPRQPGQSAAPEQHESENQIQIEFALSYSQSEHLRTKDFGTFSFEEVQACKALIQQMLWRIEERPTRRRRPAVHGRQLDMRRTLRRSLRSFGEPLKLCWRELRTHQRPLVVLCDISGSMDRYSRILLQFVHTISNGLHDVDAFVFGTRLTRITRQLRRRDIDEALSEVTRLVVDWSGGTRIGEAIRHFNFRWGRRVLGRGAVVLIISDGWDRGEPGLLAREMDRLQRSCHRLIWLNPLLGSAVYEPKTRGMLAALPFIDDFLPIHNLQSLEQLGMRLSQLSDRRPERKQRLRV